MKLSVVATMYRSADYVDIFCDRIIAAAEQLTDAFEIVLVNDGSPDDSRDKAVARSLADPRIVVVDLSRNFGHHAAIVAGLDVAQGALIYLTDIDLEEQPEWLVLFWSTLHDGGHDVVFGQQEKRVSTGIQNLSGRLFWRFLGLGATFTIPKDQMTCRLMTRQYLDALMTVEDRVLYLGGVFPWVGFDHHPLLLTKSQRPDGKGSNYSLTRKIRQAFDSISSFSAAPLTAYFVIGLVIWLGSLIFGAYVVMQRLLFPDTIQSGFTSVIFSIWFLGGLIILGIGTVGQYLSKVFQEVKNRPRYIIRAVIREGKKHDRT
jgi:putative glycosyltransferase